MTYIFVGERRSPTAMALDVTWEDGRLCACTLFGALQRAGIDPVRCGFMNLFPDEPHDDWTPRLVVLRLLDRVLATQPDTVVVGLGRRVHGALAEAGIAHREMVHPAARGLIRKTERYQAHVASVLAGAAT